MLGRITEYGSTKMKIILPTFFVLTLTLTANAQTSAGRINGTMLDPQGHPVATSDKAYPPQLSGTVVDTSGAVIAGATVQVRSANGTVQRTTQSDDERLLHYFWTLGR